MAKNSPIQVSDEWFAGEDKDLVFDCSAGDTTAMVDWELVFELSEHPGSEIILTKTGSPDISIDDIGLTVTVHIERADTENLQGDLYWYQLFKQNIDGWGMLAFGDAELQYH